MKLQRSHFLICSVVWIIVLCASQNTSAQFPGLGDDVTTSLGQFELVVNPAFQPAMVGNPGWNPGTKRLFSPLLFDPTTTIGRSAPLTAGSPGDTTGVPVGSLGTVIGNNSLSLVPSGFTPSPGTREVYTQLVSLDLTAGGISVRAGTNSDQGISAGRVTSNSGSGIPANDFPAKSFFDIFVDIDIPGLGTLSNSAPLIVQNTNLTAFPPTVVYVHGNSTAVPVVFETNNLAIGAHAGDVFGLLMLAGHGVNMTPTNSAQVAQFENSFQNEQEPPVAPQYQTWAPGLTVLPEPSTGALVVLGVLALAAARRRTKL